MSSISIAQNLPEDQYQGVVKAYGEVIKLLSTIAVCVAVLTFCFTIRMQSFGLSESPKNREEMNNQKTTSDDTNSDNKQDCLDSISNEEKPKEHVIQEKIVAGDQENKKKNGIPLKTERNEALYPSFNL